MGGGKVWGIFQQDGLAVHQSDHCGSSDMDVIEISSWEDVTVMFYGDNGLNYVDDLVPPRDKSRRSLDGGPAPSK